MRLKDKTAPHMNVNTITPGHTFTEMTAPLPNEIKKAMIDSSYLKRMAQPENIAKAILFLVSEDADFITGQLLLVDGDFSLK
jgi:3-oxoacyl-[acyl-carrier protein] reductase